MIYNINNELRNFTYITSVYKCISAYNLKGHTIGRKIGDMLEILTMGGVYKNESLVKRLDTEGKLEGFTTAGHKVEFGFYEDPTSKTMLFGAIECKCVGVEETKAGKGTAYLRKLKINDKFSVDFQARWMQNSLSAIITLLSANKNTCKIQLENSQKNKKEIICIKKGENIKLAVTENGILSHTTPLGDMRQEIPGIIRICKTIKCDKIENSTVQFSLYNCLRGPQTIEKAKQASFVAMDLRKKIDNHWGKEELLSTNKKMTFVHVICEYSHWEEKSQNVIQCCIDHNIIVPDAVIIKAFDVFEEEFGLGNMLDMISKSKYISEERVKVAVKKVFDYFDEHLFYDISLQSYVCFDYKKGKLVISPIA